MTTERQRPEGRLIASVIDASPTLSRRSVADAVGMSEARVRQIINGYASAGRGQSVEVVAPANTLAKIASAVGITPEQLVAADRPDAARVLEQLGDSHARGVVLDVDRYEQGLADLTAWMAFLGEPAMPTHPPDSALWLWTPRQLAENLAEQVATLEAADTEMTQRFHQAARRGREEVGDGHRQSAPMTSAGDDPAARVIEPEVEIVASGRRRAEPVQQPHSTPPRPRQDG